MSLSGCGNLWLSRIVLCSEFGGGELVKNTGAFMYSNM